MPRRKKEAVPVPVEELVVPEVPALPEASATPPAAALAEVLPPAPPSREECWVAAAAHGGVLLNLITGIGGPILALVLWLLYDRKSRYASWHALQALVFQVVVGLLALFLGAITVVLWVVTIPLMMAVVGFCLLPFAVGLSLITGALVLAGLIYGCAGALRTLEGKDFRYRWISDWIPPLTRP